MTDYEIIKRLEAGIPEKELVILLGLQDLFPSDKEDLVYAASLRMDKDHASFEVSYENNVNMRTHIFEV